MSITHTDLVLITKQGSISERVQLLLCLTHECIQASLHIGKLLANVVDQDLHDNVSLTVEIKSHATYLIQCFCQVRCALLVRNVAVRRMFLEEPRLVCSRILHRTFGIDVLLASVYDTNETELQRINTASKDVESIRAGVHKIELGENTNGAMSLRIDRARKLERVRVGEVNIRRRHR